MYKHFSLLALVAALVLAACSSDDDLDAVATSDSDASSTYMAVNIYMTSDAATRSTSEVSGGGYSTGTSAEYAINFDKSIFLFYASDGSYLTYGTYTTTPSGTETSGTNTDTDYVEYTYNAKVVLGPTTLTPAYVVGVFNDANTDNYKGLSLTEMQAKLFNDTDEDDSKVTVTYTENSSSSTATGILMSNAVKYESSDFSFATEIKSSNICDSEDDATNSPVNMYIERAKAKVEIGVSSNFKSTTTNDVTTYSYTLQTTTTSDGNTTTTSDTEFTYYYVDTDGNLTSVSDATVTMTINGWAVNAYNSSGYVIKNYSNNGTELSSDITGNSDAPGGAWGENWYSSYRIFWAVDGNYAASASTDTTDWSLGYYSWDELAGTSGTGCSTDAAYYYEQTLDPNASTGYDDGQTAYAPTLLVAATVGVNVDEDISEQEGAGNDIFLSYGEVLYSESAVYAKILSLLKEAGYTGDETITSIEWTTQEASKGTVTISSITMSGSTDVSKYISQVNASDFISASDESGSTTAYYLRKYDGGASYYQVPIQTYITTNSSPYGLVRNTAYSITINSVTGIGAGVPDTSTKLIEIPEEDETGYLAAKINILAWRLSSQTVDL